MENQDGKKRIFGGKSKFGFAYVNPWHAAMADFIDDMAAADRKALRKNKVNRPRAERPVLRS